MAGNILITSDVGGETRSENSVKCGCNCQNIPTTRQGFVRLHGRVNYARTPPAQLSNLESRVRGGRTIYLPHAWSA